MLAKNEGVTGKISEVEHFEYMHPAVQIAELKSNKGVMKYIHKYVFGNAIIIFSF